MPLVRRLDGHPLSWPDLLFRTLQATLRRQSGDDGTSQADLRILRKGVSPAQPGCEVLLSCLLLRQQADPLAEGMPGLWGDVHPAPG